MPYKDPDARRACLQRWRNRNPEKYAAHLSALRKIPPKRDRYKSEAYRRSQRNRALKSAYGITIEQYDEMYAKQNGLCAICQRPESRNWNQHGQANWLCVDHNHDTKQVRALLCGDCNKGLGTFQEDILRMQAAIEYLKKYSGLN